MYKIINYLPIFLANEFKMEIITQSNRNIIISKNYTPLSTTKYKEYFVEKFPHI